jgi:hypothetical protein
LGFWKIGIGGWIEQVVLEGDKVVAKGAGNIYLIFLPFFPLWMSGSQGRREIYDSGGNEGYDMFFMG